MTDDWTLITKFAHDERRRGFHALADDLDRWSRACRDPDSDIRNVDIADALEALSRRIRATAEALGR